MGGPLRSRKAMLETLVRHLDMVRLSATAAVLVLMVGCTGVIGGDTGGSGSGSGSSSATEQAALKAWENSALPVFKANCSACHDGGMVSTTGAPGYLQGTSDVMIHDTIVASSYVDLDAVQSSRVLVKGLHEGPALTTDQATAILTWLTAEKANADAAGSGSGTVALTSKFTPQLCPVGVTDTSMCPINHVDLGTIGLTGATVDFVAQQLDNAVYVTGLQLNPKASSTGAYVTHPLFVSYPSDPTMDPIPDELDRYFSYTADLMPMSAATVIDGGNAVFVGFGPTNQMSIQFETATAYDATKDTAGSGSGSGGCAAVQSFDTNARAPLNTNCASCHAKAGNAAMAAMDLTGVNQTYAANPTAVTTACNQALLQVNKNTPANSGFFVDPNPGNTTAHNFKFPTMAAYTTFATAVMTWITAETTAP